LRALVQPRRLSPAGPDDLASACGQDPSSYRIL